MADIAAILAIPAILTMISTTMPRSRLLLSIVVALVVALGLGYAWGASGRFSIQNALDDARQQLDLAQARGALLEARVSVYNVNFGDAARHFEEAKAPLRRVRERYQQVGKNAAAGSVTAALEHIDEGQRLAGKLDQAANNKANDALEAIKVASSQ
jgi:hypothetical protein